MNNFDKTVNEIYTAHISQNLLEEGFIDNVKAIGLAAAITAAGLPITIPLFKKIADDLTTNHPEVAQTIDFKKEWGDLSNLTPTQLPALDSNTTLPPRPGDLTANIPEPPTGIIRHVRPQQDTPERVLDDIRTREVIEDYIIGHEDVRHMAYDDGADNPTIGIGHFLTGTREDREIFNNLFPGELDYDRLVAGSGQVRRGRGVDRENVNLGTTPRGVELIRRGIRPQAMDAEQVRILFSRDIPVYIERARTNLNRYNIDLDELSPRHQAAWIDLQFRGDFGNELRRGIQSAQQTREMVTIVTTLETRAGRQRLDHVRNRINGNADIIRDHLQELLPTPNR